MTHVCHLFDDSSGWEQRVAAGQLFDRLPKDRFRPERFALASASMIALDQSVGAQFPNALRRNDEGKPSSTATRPGTSMAGVFAVRALLARMNDHRPRLFHAWGLRAAFSLWPALRAAGVRPLPMVISLFDPEISNRQVKWLRLMAVSGPFAVVCSTETLRRRLLAGGVPPAVTALIRPAVDFALINRGRTGVLRSRLGLNLSDRLVAVAQPLGRLDRFWDVYWAVTLSHTVSESLRLLVPADQWDRAAGHARTLPVRSAMVPAPKECSFEELMAVADFVVAPARGEISTTALAWAMAAGAAVLGTAVYSVAELIAHKVNGLLFKPTSDRKLAVDLAALLLQPRETVDKVRETARGQAYEVFGIRRFIDQHVRCYENILGGLPPGEGLVDPAAN